MALLLNSVLKRLLSLKNVLSKFYVVTVAKGYYWERRGAVDESDLEVFFPSCSAVPSEVWKPL